MFTHSLFQLSGSFTNVCQTTRTSDHIYNVGRHTSDYVIYLKLLASKGMIKTCGLVCVTTLGTIATWIIPIRERTQARLCQGNLGRLVVRMDQLVSQVLSPFRGE